MSRRRNTASYIAANLKHVYRQALTADVGADQHDRELTHGARGPPLGDQLLTVEEAAEILRCSKSALNKWRGNGNGPRFVYIGNRIRYRASEIVAFIDRCTRASTSASEAPAA